MPSDPDHPILMVMGYAEACRQLSLPGGGGVTSVISFAGHREHAVTVPPGLPHLVLDCDDAPVADPDDPLALAVQRLQLRRAAEVGLRIRPPAMADVEAMVRFAGQHRDSGGTMLLHCQAGISRSPAAALAALASWTGPGRERDCAAIVRAVRPFAQPHDGIVWLADRLLRRGGALSAALTEVFGM